MLREPSEIVMLIFAYRLGSEVRRLNSSFEVMHLGRGHDVF